MVRLEVVGDDDIGPRRIYRALNCQISVTGFHLHHTRFVVSDINRKLYYSIRRNCF